MAQMAEVETVGNVIPISENDFRWNIPNFNKLSDEKDYSVKSPRFRWDGFTWYLLLFPNGKMGLSNNELALFPLKPHGLEREDHRVVFTLGVLGENGHPIKQLKHYRTSHCSYMDPGFLFKTVTRRCVAREVRAPNNEVSFTCSMQHA